MKLEISEFDLWAMCRHFSYYNHLWYDAALKENGAGFTLLPTTHPCYGTQNQNRKKNPSISTD